MNKTSLLEIQISINRHMVVNIFDHIYVESHKISQENLEALVGVSGSPHFLEALAEGSRV